MTESDSGTEFAAPAAMERRTSAGGVAAILFAQVVACGGQGQPPGDDRAAHRAPDPAPSAPPDPGSTADTAPSDAGLLAVDARGVGVDASTGRPGAEARRADAALGLDCTTDAGHATLLGCTGLYADWTTRAIAPDVKEYDPALHLWSDGAQKNRFIFLPPGAQIDTRNIAPRSLPSPCLKLHT